TQELVWTACLANVNGMTGRLHESYEQLRAVFFRYSAAEPKLRSWVLTSLAEMDPCRDGIGGGSTFSRAAHPCSRLVLPPWCVCGLSAGHRSSPRFRRAAVG